MSVDNRDVAQVRFPEYIENVAEQRDRTGRCLDRDIRQHSADLSLRQPEAGRLDVMYSDIGAIVVSPIIGVRRAMLSGLKHNHVLGTRPSASRTHAPYAVAHLMQHGRVPAPLPHGVCSGHMICERPG